MAANQAPQHLVMFGRPGSGKSTLGEKLSVDDGYQIVRTGELLREAVRRQDDLGRQVEEHLKTGNLVPDALVFELLEQTLQCPGQEKLLFDGFPRTMGQVTLLEQFERTLGFTIDVYVEIRIRREAAETRMTGRRVCPVCGTTYHLQNKPPRVAETCDRDGARLEQRSDDRLEVIQQRQNVYEAYAVPILEHYRANAPGKVREVEGEQTLMAVYAETRRILGLGDARPSAPSS